jgi:manganese transport protein
MIIGWAINCSIILLAATAFFNNGIKAEELQQAHNLLHPLLGDSAAIVFALALFCAGFASLITSGLAGGTIFAGLAGEEYDIKDNHTRLGIIISFIIALIAIYFINDSFKALLFSQMLLSIQLPVTIISLLYLTSSAKVMGKYANSRWSAFVLIAIGALVIYLNIRLLFSVII